ncbi:LacI family DNA-binding transcriptional regulator [uncultured Limosilactobacillus sp.]|uniref:LacI family DNA-binding transcriptional regulator n=1 Tax=uncultured Limosilactobacillus sp. TaxID=2837629 RepID=UPI0025DAD3A7|nr:LacI family DNA-binding transcriptional regulator [uncultured Limosilactobacillus sp.]
MKATIKDVAKAANVSTATVSRVLANKKGTYREKTARAVRQAAERLGYRRNISAAQLAAQETTTIAVIINDTKTNFWQEVLDGIQDAMDDYQRDSIILYAGNNDPAKLTAAINAALARQVAGILLVAAKVNDEQLTLLDQCGLPYRFVSIYGEENQPGRFTSSNNIEIGQLATRYLVDHGHQRIGLVGIDKSTTGQQRLLGYQKVMSAANLVVEPDWVQYGDYSFLNGQQLFPAIRRLQLTAVITASDMTAAGIIKAARQAGMNLPTDLSVISIDGTFVCDITAPQLTSVSQNFRLMGQQSVADLLNNAASSFVPVKIVERESVVSR